MSTQLDISQAQFKQTRLWGLPRRVSHAPGKGGRNSGGAFFFNKAKYTSNIYETSFIGVEKMEAITEHDRYLRDQALAEADRFKRKCNHFKLLAQEHEFFKKRAKKLKSWIEEDGLTIFEEQLAQTMDALNKFRAFNEKMKDFWRAQEEEDSSDIAEPPKKKSKKVRRFTKWDQRPCTGKQDAGTLRITASSNHQHPGRRWVDEIKKRKTEKKQKLAVISAVNKIDRRVIPVVPEAKKEQNFPHNVTGLMTPEQQVLGSVLDAIYEGDKNVSINNEEQEGNEGSESPSDYILRDD